MVFTTPLSAPMNRARETWTREKLALSKALRLDELTARRSRKLKSFTSAGNTASAVIYQMTGGPSRIELTDDTPVAKLAFQTWNGYFTYTRFPFGLKTSGALLRPRKRPINCKSNGKDLTKSSVESTYRVRRLATGGVSSPHQITCSVVRTELLR